MKTKLFLFLSFLATTYAAQTEHSKVKRFTVVGIFDVAYNSPDKVMTAGVFHRFMGGVSYVDPKKRFTANAAVGIKLIKGNFYSPKLQNSFVKDVSDNYLQPYDTTEARTVAESIKLKEGENFCGSVGYYAQVGAMLHSKFDPSITFLLGNDIYTLYDEKFRTYSDPQHHDATYLGMSTTTYELRCGIGIPLKWLKDHENRLYLNAGYKLTDYGSLKFGSTNLSAYTFGSLAQKYRYSSKFTLSLSFMLWSN